MLLMLGGRYANLRGGGEGLPGIPDAVSKRSPARNSADCCGLLLPRVTPLLTCLRSLYPVRLEAKQTWCLALELPTQKPFPAARKHPGCGGRPLRFWCPPHMPPRQSLAMSRWPEPNPNPAASLGFLVSSQRRPREAFLVHLCSRDSPSPPGLIRKE